MRIRTIAPAFLMAALAMGGVTACNSNPTAQQDAAPAAESQANSSQLPKRAQRYQAMRQQVETVLTPEQKQQLQTKLQQGERMRKALGEINLTDDQKAKIQEIMKSARAHRSNQPATQSQ